MNIRNTILVQLVFLCLFAGTSFSQTSFSGPIEIAGQCRFFKVDINLSGAVSTRPSYNVKLNADNTIKLTGMPYGSKLGYDARIEICKISSYYLGYTCGLPGGSGSIVTPESGKSFILGLAPNSSYPTGSCEEPNPCEEKKDQLVGDGFGTYSGRYATFSCSGGCEVMGEPDEGKGFIVSMNDNFGWFTYVRNSRYTGIECSDGTGNTIEPEEVPEDLDPENPETEPNKDFCKAEKKRCDLKCPYGQAFRCDPITGEKSCICAEGLSPEPSTPISDKPTEKEKTPDSQTATGGEQAIKHSTDRIGDILNDQTGQLHDIGKNGEAIAKNTGEIAKGIGNLQTGIDGLGDKVADGVADGLEGVEDGLKNIEDGQDSIVANGETIATNTGEIVDGIGNLQTGIDGLGEKVATGVVDGIADGIKDGLEDGLKGLSNDVKDVEQAIDDIKDGLSEGEYTPEASPEAITVEGELDFGIRTSQFLSDMKKTSIFSTVSGLGNLSGSGSSKFTISSGDTFGGDHTIDFAALNEGLNALKYIFHLMGMIVALRIVTLKR
ncbi:MAG: hypothetical protein OCC45_13310 [Desulfotalea sp.]